MLLHISSFCNTILFVICHLYIIHHTIFWAKAKIAHNCKNWVQLINCENWVRITRYFSAVISSWFSYRSPLFVKFQHYLVVITVLYYSIMQYGYILESYGHINWCVTGTLSTRFGNFEDLFKANFPGQVLKVPKICAQIYFNNFSEAGCWYNILYIRQF